MSVSRSGNDRHTVGARPALGASAGFLKRLNHSPCFALRGTGIANPARGKVAGAAAAYCSISMPGC